MTEIWLSLLFLLVGYGFGCFSTGYVVAKMSGHNIQSEGSGNIGTTNALRTMGAKGGAITFAGDLLFQRLLSASSSVRLWDILRKSHIY